MNKAILVIDMPNSCDKCPLFGNHYSDLCCKALNNRGINYPYPKDFKQDWCPLREIPDKKTVGFSGIDHYAYCDGWNDCIEEILGGIKT